MPRWSSIAGTAGPNPPPPPSDPPKPIRRDLEPVDKVTPASPVDRLLKRWRRSKERQNDQRRQTPLTPDAEREVRTMIGKVNQSLTRQSVPIRLVLVAQEEGFLIDVYNCDDEQSCRTIADLLIDLDDLPVLLRNLEQEVGILVDTVS